MNNSSKAHTNRILPPWLWVWLVVYFLALPNLISVIVRPRLDELFSLIALPRDELGQFDLFRLMNIVELAPFLIVFLGVLAIFAPWARAALLQRSYRLGEPPPLPAVLEISDFLSQHAPGLRVRANLLRTDQLAFVYPLGYRTFAIALFGGIVKLWRTDQQAAEAVLLHEIAHYRQGDALIVGAGSFFETLLRRWLLLFFGFVTLPLVLQWGYSLITFIRDLSALQELGVTVSFMEILLHQINVFFRIYLPGWLLLSIGVLFWTVSIVVPPLIGIWCAELNADRFAIEAQQSRVALTRAMEKLPRRTSKGRWLLFWMSHPPDKLRRWMARRSNGITGLVLLLLLFPLAYIFRMLVLLGRATTGYLSIEPEEIVRVLGANAEAYLEQTAPLWLSMAVLVLFWPIIARYWEWLFSRKRGALSWTAYQGYIAAALLIGVLATSGYDIGQKGTEVLANQAGPTAQQGKWSTGTLVEVEWQGQWYEAVILDIEGELFNIHYDGWDSSWDEWVDASRIRSRSQ